MPSSLFPVKARRRSNGRAFANASFRRLDRSAKRGAEQLCCKVDLSWRLGDGMLVGIPLLAAGQHGVEDADQLAHASDEGDLGFLALGDEALVASLEHWIVLSGGAEA